MSGSGPLHTLSIRNLTVRKGGVPILEGVDADIRCGEVTALVGPNGAGKTTLLQAILGQVPYTGEIRFCRAQEHGEGEPRIGYVPQHLPLDRDAPVTVLDFFALSSQRRPVFLGSSRKTRAAARECLERAGVAHLLRRPLGRLSGGELQRVLFALALRDDPDILLLDEPSEGLAPLIVREIGTTLQALKAQRLSLLLVEQNYHLALRVADRVYVMNKGQIVYQGTPAGLEADEEVKRRYLGVA